MWVTFRGAARRGHGSGRDRAFSLLRGFRGYCGDVELVGREKELATLDRALDRLDRRNGGWLEVLGEPGIGKSALLAELDARADSRGCLVLGGRGAEYERDVPFAALLDALDASPASSPDLRLNLHARDRLVELSTIFPSLEPI